MTELIVHIKKSIYHRFKEEQENCPPLNSWTQTTFEQLANNINDVLTNRLTDEKRQKLGIRVSSSTLKRIFKYGYKLGPNIDPRKKKTLDLLCIYLGFDSLDIFINHKKQQLSSEDVSTLIRQATKAEYHAYQNVPLLKTDELQQYFHSSGPAFEKIAYNLSRFINSKQTINTPLNPSTHQLIKCSLKKIDKAGIWIETKEYWYLKWHNIHDQEHKRTYNALNRQIYLITAIDGVWKIWSNMYDSENDFTMD